MPACQHPSRCSSCVQKRSFREHTRKATTGLAETPHQKGWSYCRPLRCRNPRAKWKPSDLHSDVLPTERQGNTHAPTVSRQSHSAAVHFVKAAQPVKQSAHFVRGASRSLPHVLGSFWSGNPFKTFSRNTSSFLSGCLPFFRRSPTNENHESVKTILFDEQSDAANLLRVLEKRELQHEHHRVYPRQSDEVTMGLPCPPACTSVPHVLTSFA